MSTIAYRDGIMAADTGGWIGAAKHENARKIAIGMDGTLYGTVGHGPECAGFIKWVDGGQKDAMPMPEKMSDGESSFLVMIVDPHGTIRLLSAWGYDPLFGADYFAIGGGAAVAFGALHAGASAYDAIRAALTHSNSAAGFVQQISHPK